MTRVSALAAAAKWRHDARMIDALKNLFRPEPNARAEVAPDVAVAALLIEAARADGVYDVEERRAVLSILCDMFDVDAPKAEALHEAGEAAQRESPDLVRFTRIVKLYMDEAERVALFEALWHIVLVDHDRDPHENALMRHLAPLLAVSDHDSAAARRRVLARIGPLDA